MKKRLFSILLCIVVCMAMMPLGVYGATTYNWTVNGIKVTSDNQDNVLGDGTVSYDKKSNTLNLKNANIKNIWTGTEHAVINVEGSNSVIDSNYEYVIYSSRELTIKSNGSGELAVEGVSGIWCNSGELTFNSVVVNATGTSRYGIYCKTGNINIENSKITAKGGSGFFGIYTTGKIIAEDAMDGTTNISKETLDRGYCSGTIDNKFDKYAIWVAGKQVTSRNADDVLGDETGSVSYDFDAKTLTLNNAKISGSYSQPDGYTGYKNWGAITWSSSTDNQYLRLMLEGENTVTNDTLDGICAYGPFDIAGDGKLTVKGEKNGIYTSGAIIIAAGGGIDVTGEKSGISAAQKVKIESYVKATGKSEAGISSGRDVYISGKVEAKGSSSTAISAVEGISWSTEEIELENGLLAGDKKTLTVKDANANGGYAAISPVNYTLYYNAANGKMYKSYDNGTFSNEYTKGNWSSSKSEGSNKYDVLTLNNFKFETAAGTGLKIIGIDAGETFTIKGTGENHIILSGTGSGYGIYTDGSLNFDGGRMYINIEEYADAKGAVYAGGDINLTDCELYDGGELLYGDIIRVNPKGISAGGAFVIENADVRTNCIEAAGGISAREYMQIKYLTVTEKKGTSVTKVEAASSEKLLTIYGRLIAKFDADGGKWSDITDTTKSVPVSLDGNRYIILPEEDPVREGYNFTGWLYKDGNKFSEKDKYEISEGEENLFPESVDVYEEFGYYYIFSAQWKKLCTEHTFGSWKVTKQPTATEKGEKTRICSVCEYKETAEIPATGSSTVVTPVQKPEIAPVTGGDVKLSEDGTSLDITPADGMEIEKVTVNGKEVAVKDGRITGLKTGDKVVVTFVKKSPSKEDEYKDITDSINDLKLAVITSKTSKKNIKVKVKVKKGSSLIKELESKGYTVKYKFYKSTKKASKYKAVKTKTSNTFINTNGKKGTKYYYKAKVLVYDGKKLVAQTALKQCSYSCRTWSK